MPRILIVGDRDSGKTTFLVLLYAAQVRSGSDRADDFRFHVAYESMDEISDAYQQLMSGSFPDSAAKEGIREITFHLGYRKPGLGILSRLRSRGWTPGSSASLRFLLLRNLGDEVNRLRKGSSLAKAALRDVLESDTIAILVDSRKLVVKPGGPEPGTMHEYDSDVDSLLAAVQQSQTRGDHASLALIFIFSKFDSVDPRSLRAADIADAPPETSETGPRAAYAAAILKLNLPKTLARISPREPRGTAFAKPSYFFSSVRTEPAAAGRRERIRLRRRGGAGWEPDFAQDEYFALLETLRKIAADGRE